MAKQLDESTKKEIKDIIKEVLEEGPKKYPGVSKKAKGGVGWAKHARKGPGKQFNKGVRQAGKKQIMQGEASFDSPDLQQLQRLADSLKILSRKFTKSGNKDAQKNIFDAYKLLIKTQTILMNAQ